MGPPVSEEEVLVIPESRMTLLGGFRGFRPFCQQAFEALLNPEFMLFRPRSQVEEDPSFKQLIPYVVLQAEVDAEVQVFQYTRGKGQGEKRLHALRSVGIGGHISRADASCDDLYRRGMQRELNEETLIESPYQERLVGFIYDDTSPVGRVHLGVVHLLTLDQPKAKARELELTDSGFVPLSRLKAELDRFETWSQLCLVNLFR
jgi:predicted NUDIX family phosphoesterase